MKTPAAFTPSARAVRFRMSAASLLAIGLGVLLAQAGGQAQGSAGLPYSTGYLVTGDYVVGSVDITDATNFSATGTIHIGNTPANTVPQDADIIAAFLYWETIAPSGATPQQIADFVKFRGKPIKSVRVKSVSRPLTGSTASCFSSASGFGPLTMTMFRADVLRLLPRKVDKFGKPTGKLLVNDADLTNVGLHTVTVPESGSGNVIPQSAGASLVLVYRDPSLPLKKISVYDGIYIQPQGETTIQTLRGWYQSDPIHQSRYTPIVASGAKNSTDQLFFNNSLVANDPFPGAMKSSDRAWSGVTYDVTSKMPGTDIAGQYGETATAKVTHTKSTPYECLTFAAEWFSTTVLDADDPNGGHGDGIPDRLENGVGVHPVLDPNGVALPDLYAMGARPDHKDIFIHLNALRTTAALTTYGSASAPYDSGAGPDGIHGTPDDTPVINSVDAPPHNHMAPSEVLTNIGDVYRNAPVHNKDGVDGIKAHIDVGDPAAYHALGADYAGTVGAGDQYLVPAALAKAGQIFEETACANDPSCFFPGYPGTIGWGFSLQKFLLAHVDKNRFGLFHTVVYAHSRGKPKSLPCLDPYGTPTLYDSPTSPTCSEPNTNNPNWYPLDYHVPTSSSGAGDLPGNKVLVSLGRWESFVGTAFIRASTTIHEIGHNLGLWHGGNKAKLINDGTGLIKFVEPNCKSNYPSVMSYLFQIRGLPDFANIARINLSDRANPTIHEPGLTDLKLGLQLYHTAWYAPLGLGTAVDVLGLPAAAKFCNGQPFPAGSSINMARYDAPTLSGDIDWATNGFVLDQSAAGQDTNLDNIANTDLTGFNDWANIQLDQVGGGYVMGGAISNGGSDFGGSDFGGSDFGGSDFGGSDFGGSDFGGLDLDGSDFGGSDFGGSDFGGLGFSGDAELSHEDALALAANPPNELNACVLGGNSPTSRPGFGQPACADAYSPSQLHRVKTTWKWPHIGEVSLFHLFRVTGDSVTPSSVPVEVGAPGISPATAGCPLSTDLCSFIDTEELPEGLQAEGQQFTYYVKADLSTGKKTPASNFATIKARNDAPIAIEDAKSTNEDTALVGNVLIPNPTASDSDADSAALHPVLVSGPSNGTLLGPTGLNADGSFTYAPNPNFFGIDNFTYKLVAGTWPPNPSIPFSGDSKIKSVTIIVNPVNDAPSFARGGNDTVLEDSGPRSVATWATSISVGPANEANGTCDSFIAGAAAAAAACHQTVSFLVTNSNNALFSAQPAVSADGTLTYTPAPDAYGTATVSVAAKDSGGTANGGTDTSASQTFEITVTPVNDRPSFTKGANQAVLEDAGAQSVSSWATNISAGPANEADGSCVPLVAATCQQTVSFLVTNDNNALFSSQPAVAPNGTLTFTPAADANGSATVTVTAKDTGGTANGGADTSDPPQTFTITVTPVNDRPSFTNAGNQTVGEDAGPQSVAAWVTSFSAGPANEADQTVLAYHIVDVSNPALFSFSAGPAVDNAGTLTYTPAPNANGSATITITVQDTGGVLNGGVDTSLPQTFTITVKPVNDQPTAHDQSVTTTANTSKVVTLTGSDVETPPANLTFAIVTPPAHGVLAGPAPNLTYKPETNYNGPDSFTFTVTDRGDPDNCGAPSTACAAPLASAPGTVSITVFKNQAIVVARPDEANTSVSALHIINLDTGAIDASPALASNLLDVAVTPDHTTALVTGFFDQKVTFVDLTTNPPTVTGSVALGFLAEDIDIDAAGTFAVVADGDPAGGSKKVSSINIATKTVVSTLTLGADAHGATFVPNHNLVLVNSAFSNTVRVLTIDGTGTLTDNGTFVSIAGDAGPLNVQPSPDGSMALVTNFLAGTITVLHISPTDVVTVGATVTPAAGHTLANPQSIAFDPTGSYAYVALTGGDLAVLQIVGGVVTDSGVRIGGTGTRQSFFGVDQITATANGHYVVVHGEGVVSVIDPVTNTIVRTIAITNDARAGGIASIR